MMKYGQILSKREAELKLNPEWYISSAKPPRQLAKVLDVNEEIVTINIEGITFDIFCGALKVANNPELKWREAGVLDIISIDSRYGPTQAEHDYILI